MPVERAHVSCATTVFHSSFPPRESTPHRIILGTATIPKSLPRAQLIRGRRYWHYSIKFAIWLRDGGPPAIIAVAKPWRQRVAMTWGDSRNASSIRFTSCPATTAGASGWSGVLNLTTRTACVPLIVHVQSNSRRLLLPIGRRCS
jgi:hypothetical protein